MKSIPCTVSFWTISSLILLVTLAFCSVAQAGMAVSDTTSYSYYVEQLKKDVELIEKQLEAIEEAKNLVAEAERAYDMMTEVYNDAMNLVYFAQTAKERIERNPATALGYLKRLLPDPNAQEAYLDENGYVNTGELLQDMVLDPTNADVKSVDVEAQRATMGKKAQLSAIDDAEHAIQGIEEDLKELEKVMEKIGETGGLKESMDLNNHILAACLNNLIQMKKLIARLVSMESMLNLILGNDPAEMAKGEGAEGIKGQAVGYKKLVQYWLDKAEEDGFYKP